LSDYLSFDMKIDTGLDCIDTGLDCKKVIRERLKIASNKTLG